MKGCRLRCINIADNVFGLGEVAVTKRLIEKQMLKIMDKVELKHEQKILLK